MKKVFLYLYPIEEYTKKHLLPDELYDEWNIKRPLPILNECIQKRYRDQGYQVVFALYSDKNMFGIIPKEEDKIIYMDILFSENSASDEHEKEKRNFIPKYPNEQLLMKQLGDVEHLVIGGYHFSSCVKRMGEIALTMGINVTIDLDLTDLFFSLYEQEEYFNIKEYNPEKFKKYMIEETTLKQFNLMYSSLCYGFSNEEETTFKK